MDRKKASLILVVFALGWILSDVFSAIGSFGLQKPFSDRAKELPSPSDWIQERNIHVNKENIVIDLKNAEWASFYNTNSMDPIIDETSNGIEIKPKSEDDIKVGDIVSYLSEKDFSTIIHRVVEIGSDEKGKYFIMKGDNNAEKDPEKVRFIQIKRVLVAVIY